MRCSFDHRARARLAALLLALPLIAIAPRTARASIEPEHAAHDVAEARKGHDAFCRKPPKELSSRQERLCPLAAKVDGCESLVERCDAATATKKEQKPPEVREPKISPGLTSFARVLLWMLVGAVVIALAIPAINFVRNRRRDQALTDEAPKENTAPLAEAPPPDPLPTEAEALLARADQLASRGELSVALSTYLHAALASLDQRGVLTLGKHRTNGEYVRACSDANARAVLRELVLEVDVAEYGGRQPTVSSVSAAAARARSLVRGAAIATLALAMMVLGCGEGASSFDERDPAGLGLFARLCERQGLAVAKAGGALGALPLGDPKDRARLLVIPTDRVPIDEDTEKHLVAWVRKGGRLLLAGHPSRWPKGFEAEAKFAPGAKLEIEDPLAPGDHHATRVGNAGLAWEDAQVLATTESGATVAAVAVEGEGLVLGIADDDLLTNLSLVHEGNAEALLVLVSSLEQAHRTNAESLREVRLLRNGEGVTPASNPMSAMHRAGFGMGLWHLLIATFVLFAAVGVRSSRPTPTPPAKRRAFSEHVAANGILYARAGIAQRALALYVAWVEQRLRLRMPKGAHDPAAFLASRTGADPAEVAAIWQRAEAADVPRDQALASLRRLRALWASAQQS